MDKLKKCVAELVIDDSVMKENSLSDITDRLRKTFGNKQYKRRLAETDKNWLEIDIDDALNGIQTFVEEI